MNIGRSWLQKNGILADSYNYVDNDPLYEVTGISHQHIVIGFMSDSRAKFYHFPDMEKMVELDSILRSQMFQIASYYYIGFIIDSIKAISTSESPYFA